MTLLLICFLGQLTDTITLPEPAAAIAVEEGILGFLHANGEELFIQDASGWREYSLPARFNAVQRILLADERCFVLSQRRLIMVDLRENRMSVIATEVDDAVLTAFDELWIMSDYELRRLTFLGRELEKRTLGLLPHSIWADEQGGVSVVDDLGRLVPGWLALTLEDDLFLPELDNVIARIVSATTADLTTDDWDLYLLLDPRTVLKIPKELK